MQEVLLARNVEIYVGEEMVTWKTLESLFNRLSQYESIMLTHDHNVYHKIITTIKSGIPWRMWFHRMSSNKDPKNSTAELDTYSALTRLLEGFGSTDCGVIHDKIYALLSLTGSEPAFPIDYACSTLELFSRVVSPLTANKITDSSCLQIAAQLSLLKAAGGEARPSKVVTVPWTRPDHQMLKLMGINRTLFSKMKHNYEFQRFERERSMYEELFKNQRAAIVLKDQNDADSQLLWCEDFVTRSPDHIGHPALAFFRNGEYALVPEYVRDDDLFCYVWQRFAVILRPIDDAYTIIGGIQYRFIWGGFWDKIAAEALGLKFDVMHTPHLPQQDCDELWELQRLRQCVSKRSPTPVVRDHGETTFNISAVSLVKFLIVARPPSISGGGGPSFANDHTESDGYGPYGLPDGSHNSVAWMKGVWIPGEERPGSHRYQATWW